MICICPNCNHVFESSEIMSESRKITPVQVYDIIDLCCNHFDVTRQKLFSRHRGEFTSKARHVAIYLIYGEKMNGISEEKVGKYFKRDHTSILHARNRCKNSLFTKLDVYNDLITLSQKAEEILKNPLIKQRYSKAS